MKKHIILEAILGHYRPPDVLEYRKQTNSMENQQNTSSKSTEVRFVSSWFQCTAKGRITENLPSLVHSTLPFCVPKRGLRITEMTRTLLTDATS